MKDIHKLQKYIADTVKELPEEQLKTLAPAIVKATAELEAQLTAVIGTDYEHRWTSQSYRRALVQLRPAMQKLNELEPILFDHLIAGNQDAINLAIANLEETFKFYRDKGHEDYNFERSQFIIPVKEAARTSQAALIDRYQASAARYPEAVRKDVRLQLAVSMIKGETPHQMARRIAPKISKHVEPGKAVGQALQKRYMWWAERIVRTEMIESYNAEANEAHKALYNVDPDVRIEWVATNDMRECALCASLDGERVVPGQLFQGIFDYPPAHSACRCTTVIWLPR